MGRDPKVMNRVMAAAVMTALLAAPVASPVAWAAIETPRAGGSGSSTPNSDYAANNTSGGTQNQSGSPSTETDEIGGGGNNGSGTETGEIGGSGNSGTETGEIGGSGNSGSSSSSSGSSSSGTTYWYDTDTSGTSSSSTYYYTTDYTTGSTSTSTTTTTTGTTTKSANWSRLGGTDRYETMSQIVSTGWSSSSWAVLATGTSFPDALTASSLAGAHDCPVLLTDGMTLSPQAKSQIERLGVKDLYIVGGEGAISEAVANEIAALGVTIHRVSGADRVATSVEAFKEARAAGSTSDCVIIATGDAFADALSIGAWSFQSKTPIILARGGQLTDEAIAAIQADPQVKRVIIVGGEVAVPDSVKDQLGDGYEYERLAGANRYETCGQIATWAASHGLSTTRALVATGGNYPDALAGAALAGHLGAIMLLEDGTGTASRWLTDHGASVTNSYVLGGTAAVSDSAMAALK